MVVLQRKRRYLELSLAVVVVSGCGGGGAPSAPPPERGTLSAGQVAHVGREEILADTVARIGAAQGLTPEAARELAIRDALFASEARASGVATSAEVERAVDAMLARRLMQQLLVAAQEKGPVTDEELRQATARRWLELDRPEGFRTVHAVVRLADGADETARARAAEVARAIRAAVLPVGAEARVTPTPSPAASGQSPSDPAVESFRRAVEPVPHEGFEVTVEPLQPITANGRVMLLEGGRYDETFARAAAELGARGDVSPPVTTSFGVHIILLLERTPASSVPVEERRRMVRDEVLWDRARAAQKSMLEGLRRDVYIERSADALLALVPVER